MAAMPPLADRPRPATLPTRRARPPQRPRPWRPSRLLVLVLTMSLVATLGTRALAEDPDGGSFFGEAPGTQTVSRQSPAEQPSTDAALLPDRNSGDAIEIFDTGGGSSGGTTDWQASATVEERDSAQQQQDQSRGPAAA